MRGRRALVGTLCLAAACGGQGGESGGEPDSTSASVIGSEAPAEPAGPSSAPVQNVTEPTQTIAAGALAQVNNLGVTGSMNVRGIGEQTEVGLNVTSVPTGTTSLRGAIVQGTCDRPGAEVAPVGPLTVGAGGIIALTDTVAVGPGTVLDGAHVLILKGENAGPATPALACGLLPRWERAPSTG